mmetsp:Transcript_31619/g.89835  ORF Transcript_31619/g.89835 Transcript_31619/m.89835 type:complete len:165 (-) Transcript_31619:40-534(-)
MSTCRRSESRPTLSSLMQIQGHQPLWQLSSPMPGTSGACGTFTRTSEPGDPVGGQVQVLLDDQLTPNVRYWAAYNHDRFTTEAVSTQRGEGLNRHLGEEAFDFAPVDRSLATADPNLVDHPRCITADRLREELPVGAESARGCPVATSGRCLALSPVRPSTQAF